MRILRTGTTLIACMIALASCAAEPPPVPAPTSGSGSPETSAPPNAAPRSASKTSAAAAAGWQPVPPDDDRPDGIALSDVAATGPDSAWAVGRHAEAEDDSSFSGALLRVDGSGWRSEQGISGRILGEISSDFTAVDADASGEAWAVGSVDAMPEDSSTIEQVPLALRWNGRDWDFHMPFDDGWDLSSSLKDRKNRWLVDRLTDVAVDGRRAVLTGLRGSQDAGEISSPVLLTWVGRRFSRREYRRGGRFNAVDAGAGQVWIAGTSSSGRCADSRPAIWHSSSPGDAPTRMTLPRLGRGSLRHIWQNGPSDVWAVGEIGTGWACGEDGRPGGLLVLHWNGTSWKKITLPRWKVSLQSVTAVAADDVWVAGVDHSSDAQPTQVTLLHYDGEEWTRDDRDVGGETCGDGFTITRLLGSSRLLLAGSARCGDGTRHILHIRR